MKHWELSGYPHPNLIIQLSAEDETNSKDPEGALRKLAHNYGYTLPEKFDIFNVYDPRCKKYVYRINVLLKDTEHESDNEN